MRATSCSTAITVSSSSSRTARKGLSAALGRTLTAIAVGAAALFASPASMADMSNETLVVSFAVAPPFVTLRNSMNQPEGVDVALVKELQRRAGFKTESGQYDITSFNTMMELGMSGQADIVAGAITANKERAKYYSVSEPYVYNSAVIVTRKGEKVRSLDDLNGRIMAVQSGSNMTGLIGNRNIRLFETPSNFMIFYAVSRGLADALVIDEIIAREYIAIWPDANLQVAATLPGSEGGIALFFKKDSPNSERLQRIYNQMMADGTVDRIVRKELKNFFDSQSAYAHERQNSKARSISMHAAPAN
ncbi:MULTISPECIES: transporter substrate-binding domain-containing protein [unclassified Anaerobiospirillum]|uniref:substrate-binding periplasmic protein n=1 Tax=unclassified Anaerobiospirillum TaxID=2647410 RepID=UPI001FF6E5FD|nr:MULTISPECIES: transporter substrate-binding domain-containing protein [unclassified Anaerobiospirillum]MCK0535964.1 transporter substrate-binding domain-containing protein [Anaerobiospirillum sp. NML120511]MCK0541158.1 transporter substrate-binding domain-containing protein [Anaerobiospirillum sp. NML02-A-032]